MMRIGIFGGSFDPIHYGHLLVAEQCREQARLDRVLLIPTAVGPFKQQGAAASDRHRTEMLELAIGGHPQILVSTVEIDRGEISYTVDTLDLLHESYPDDELFLIMGADTLAGFDQWKSPNRICELAIPLVIERPGNDQVNLDVLLPYVDKQRFELIQQNRVSGRQFDFSSTDIRERLATGNSIRYQTPRAVEKYIETKKLYR